jgi:PLP dependent protein
MMAVQDNLSRVHDEIRLSLKAAKRVENSCALIAVSKMVQEAPIRAALMAGQRHFGENYVQEATEKWGSLKQEFPDICLHMIGPLQSNKANEAVNLFDVIHSLDRSSLAKALSVAIAKTGKKPQLFVQVNTGEEPQKGGILPANLEGFLIECAALSLKISGLMCIPPFEKDPSPHFAFLQVLSKKHNLPTLSMGMSADFNEAIALGASFVRVGTAIFGAR